MKKYYFLVLLMSFQLFANTETFEKYSEPVIPTFNPIPDLCINSTPPALQNVSNNGITGTWSPAVINTSVPGTSVYTFIPSAGQDATTVTISIDVVADSGATLTVFCAETASSYVTFDWANVTGWQGYNYSYSIDGGPLVFGSQVSPSNFLVPISSAGQSVTFTIESVIGLPCVPPATATCSGPLSNDDFTRANFKISPNPVTDVLHISGDQYIQNIKVFDLIGKEFLNHITYSKDAQIDMTHLQGGVYLVRVNSENSFEILRIIKK